MIALFGEMVEPLGYRTKAVDTGHQGWVLKARDWSLFPVLDLSSLSEATAWPSVGSHLHQLSQTRCHAFPATMDSALNQTKQTFPPINCFYQASYLSHETSSGNIRGGIPLSGPDNRH